MKRPTIAAIAAASLLAITMLSMQPVPAHCSDTRSVGAVARGFGYELNRT